MKADTRVSHAATAWVLWALDQVKYARLLRELTLHQWDRAMEELSALHEAAHH